MLTDAQITGYVTAHSYACVFMLGVGVGLLLRVHHMIEAWALQTLPPWLVDLSVSL